MKILNVAVIDPRRRDDYKNPYLNIEIDVELNETGEARKSTDGHWRVIPHGPYFAVDHAVLLENTWQNANLGKFNVTHFHREALVECMVTTPSEVIDLALGLDRARRLLKRHAPDWHYIMDDLAGQRGEALWRLAQSPLLCVTCNKPAVGEAFFRQTHLAFCSSHVNQHNARVRNMRTSSSTS